MNTVPASGLIGARKLRLTCSGLAQKAGRADRAFGSMASRNITAARQGMLLVFWAFWLLNALSAGRLPAAEQPVAAAKPPVPAANQVLHATEQPVPAGEQLAVAAEQPGSPISPREARLAAVIRFAENVLEKGRDRYGEHHTPLFVDGLNVDTLQPVRWVHEGKKWIPSNLAGQQNLFRTLVGLSNLTGEPRYRRAAAEAIAYHFEHLRSPCGLLYWGGHRFIDLETEDVVGEQNSHELKFNLPFYELMWEVDPAATRQFLRAFWNAHVLDWSTLDFNRHGTYGRPLGELWDHEFAEPEPFFEGNGLTFINTGTDLVYAGVMLYKFTGEPGALLWSKRLAHQYVRARHPKTGLGAYQYSKPRRRREPPTHGAVPTSSSYGDRAENQFGAEFGPVAREGWMIRSPDSIYGVHAVVELQLAEMLGPEGKELAEWTRNGLRACAQWLYDPKTNLVRPAWADGTDLTGYVIKRDGYYGKAGTVFRARSASSMLLWAYVLGHRLTGDPMLWQTARSMGRAHGLGDLGLEPGREVQVNLKTDNADPVALIAVLELFRPAPETSSGEPGVIETSSGEPAHFQAPYRELACRIGDNILQQRFHRGFFLPTEKHINARFDALEPLALLSLEAMLRGKPETVPRYRAGRGYIHGPHDGLGRTTDATAIWSRTR